MNPELEDLFHPSLYRYFTFAPKELREKPPIPSQEDWSKRLEEVEKVVGTIFRISSYSDIWSGFFWLGERPCKWTVWPNSFGTKTTIFDAEGKNILVDVHFILLTTPAENEEQKIEANKWFEKYYAAISSVVLRTCNSQYTSS